MITITINTNNAAFEDGYSEVARILATMAKQIEQWCRVPSGTNKIYDVNGNVVGAIKC